MEPESPLSAQLTFAEALIVGRIPGRHWNFFPVSEPGPLRVWSRRLSVAGWGD